MRVYVKLNEGSEKIFSYGFLSDAPTARLYICKSKNLSIYLDE